MLEKMAIGTANFTQPYGVLSSENKSLDKTVVHSIVNDAQNAGIKTFDTAFGYGDFLSILQKDFPFSNSKIITKFSALDSYGEILAKLQKSRNEYGLVYEGLLIHDPQNLSKIDAKLLCDFFESVKDKGYVKKIGVSVYDFKEVEAFKKNIKPDLIQIPLNPLNQAFRNNDFIDYIHDNNVEVHARSLFLQGVLLSDDMPPQLRDLEPVLEKFSCLSKEYDSKLEALLTWADAQTFVKKWVLGVASVDNSTTLLTQAENIRPINDKNIYDCFSGEDHSLADPRNWKKV